MQKTSYNFQRTYFTISNNLEIASTLIEESAANNQLKNIPLSNNTISQRIQDISSNIK